MSKLPSRQAKTRHFGSGGEYPVPVMDQRPRRLDDLPDELLDDIFSYFGPFLGEPTLPERHREKERADDFVARNSLSKVSKRFHRLAEPRIYQDCGGFRNRHDFRKLLCTLVCRSGLAAVVKHIDISGIFYSNDQTHLPAGCADVLVAAQQLHPIEEGHFVDDQKDAEAALLLLLCRNLEALEMDLEFRLVDAVTSAVSKTQFDGAPVAPLATLTCLTLNNTALTLPRFFISKALAFPALRRTRILGLGRDPLPEPVARSARRPLQRRAPRARRHRLLSRRRAAALPPLRRVQVPCRPHGPEQRRFPAGRTLRRAGPTRRHLRAPGARCARVVALEPRDWLR
ncbi:hypothetical protein MPH_02583 [Macrophomina phaseolina MS6]|uniref:F-box domain-containing protein n=1 Tax=Macrophomina phaseolina (strain MS6) TaxID=1126212 RepID=K2SCG5_MACPH|nr:hypothetical protein MPH_02583 [Macrophomina phaseolina MS6]